MNPLDPTSIITFWGAWALVAVSVIIFIETAFLVGSFLPGDSLLFTLGLMLSSVLTATPIWLALIAVFVSAVLGSQVGYVIGRAIGPRMFRHEKSRFFNPRVLARGQEFFNNHGNNALILARFVPVIRALIPVLVGMSLFNPRRFLILNVVGALLWVPTLMLLGYGLGYIPWVAHNVEWVILAIVVLSSLPFPIGVLREWMKRRRSTRAS